MTLGSQMLSFPSGGFKPMIDSGTSLTILDSPIFDAVIQPLRKLIKLKEIRDPRHQVELCYEGTLGDLNQIPPITFHFSGGAELTLSASSMFLMVGDGVVCVAMVRNRGISILGNFAQQSYIVGYDLLGGSTGRIYFGPDDCRYF
ncbi:aspartic proteinase CDR1-like [Tasmannia lanceolata]|uniref:aspartic proteinase CDR1-like n=1 Tax=Tasmannia lanceolata TaxID=3420 RepID=UPI004064559A